MDLTRIVRVEEGDGRMDMVSERVKSLRERYLSLSLRDKKLHDAKELMEELVDKGLVKVREPNWRPESGTAEIYYPIEDVEDKELRSLLLEIRDWVGVQDIGIEVTTQDMEGNDTVVNFREEREKLEELGFVVREEIGTDRTYLVARYLIDFHGLAKAYICVDDWRSD